jgi:hypothetical protein
MWFSIQKVFAQLNQLSFGREKALSVRNLGEFLVHKTCYSKYSLTLRPDGLDSTSSSRSGNPNYVQYSVRTGPNFLLGQGYGIPQIRHGNGVGSILSFLSLSFLSKCSATSSPVYRDKTIKPSTYKTSQNTKRDKTLYMIHNGAMGQH